MDLQKEKRAVNQRTEASGQNARRQAYGNRGQNMPVRKVSRPPYPAPSRTTGKITIDAGMLIGGVALFLLLLIAFFIIAFLPGKSGADKDGAKEPSENGVNWEQDGMGDMSGEDTKLAGGAEADENRFLICIDPGHGYDDVGTSYKFLGDEYEKDINLKVSKMVVEILREKGYDVITTRDSDTPDKSLKPNDMGNYVINPAWRCDFANSNKVSLFVSLHCNSFEKDESVNGARIYYYSASEYGSKDLGNAVSKAIATVFSLNAPSVTGLDGEAAYAVTKRIKAPSVLVEMGFVTNKKDAENLKDSAWQKKMASAVAEGIIAYASDING